MRRSDTVLLALASLVAVTMLSYMLVERRQLDDLHRTMASRAELYAATIGGALAKYEFLPLAIAQSDEVAALLETRSPDKVERVNAYLEEMNQRAGAFAVYVINPQGEVYASSNWKEPTSYVGQNYGFRPYFRQAATGGTGRFYGIGVSTREAGHFIALPIRRHGRIIGVAAAKVSLDWLEQSWRMPSVAEQIWVTDANGVILLSSISDFKFKTLAPLSESARKSILEQRQFLHETLPPLPYRIEERLAGGAMLLSLKLPSEGGSSGYMAVSSRLNPLEWQITVLAELGQVRAAARNAAIAAALGWTVLWLGILYALQRRRRIAERLNAQQALKRANDELEVKVEQRTAALRDANQRLQAEVSERERAEQTLRHAQAELVQSGKLAAIGQMAAGITHELNQPLAAIQTFSDNAQVLITRGRADEALENLSVISDLVKRLGYITSQLKGFARRSDDAKKPISVRKAFEQTMLQVRTNRGAGRLVLNEDWPEQDIVVLCNETGLQQVFSNLITNSMDAMGPADIAHISIRVTRSGNQAEIRVADNGPGISPACAQRIFEPFFTTKEHGLGLGLSISAGIIRAAGGSIQVRNHDSDGHSGAEFIIRLRCQPQDGNIDRGEQDA
ncbi:two-component sensor [Noviherbaspirillum autotrophicum]|uniref:C4-dicarboxylate transport sensor protein DctB n=1 Tax=Noviherbaspirillum autotrophicum TaxID=709839 RepID=A0A0C1YTC6_9BURK|nr:two-component sensor [Noviherbaspirillum autotrophicum]